MVQGFQHYNLSGFDKLVKLKYKKGHKVNLITLETLDLVSGSQHQSNRKRDRPDPRVRFKNPFAYINTPSRASLRYECHISVNAANYHSIYRVDEG